MYTRHELSLIRPQPALIICLILLCTVFLSPVRAQTDLPIADVHIHYSHDSVEMTPPERVIELMRDSNLKFALVSSSDDNGTQLLSELAPDLIVPGLRPYRRRGETNTWFNDPAALEYVETLLANNVYATIGEFHLYGDDANLEIPRRVVELAEKHNLILHAHSDAAAVENLLAQSETVKVIWAHSGFDSPEAVSEMLDSHDRLWADLAFRSEVGSGGLSKAWRKLFEDHPTRMMLGTDTYTPERMYFMPEHASGARTWLETLPAELAQNIAWRNAFNLIMPIWEENKGSVNRDVKNTTANACGSDSMDNVVVLQGKQYKVLLQPAADIKVSQASSLKATVCGQVDKIELFSLDASMPAHGHGTNYRPTVSLESSDEQSAVYQIDGVVLHMPGNWQWEVDIDDGNSSETLTKSFTLQ